MDTKRGLGAVVVGVALFVGAGCGYSFQHTRNPLLDKYGIRKVYVAPLVNDTYKPGVENLVYNELVRVISSHKRVKLVPRMEDADAVLKGTVADASYIRSGTTSAASLFPPRTGDEAKPWVPEVSSNVLAATEYSASLACSFNLTVQNPTVSKSLWSAGFGRTKPFPANNQLGSFGTTSALINESEFDRALSEMARSMMADVHEAMLAMF